VTRSIARAGLMTLALTVSGCALTFDSTELGVPTSLAEPAAAPAQGTPFSVTRHPVFLLWGFVPVASPNAEDVLAGQVGTASRIANLKIKVRTRWSDFLITVASFGTIVPKSVTFEGVIVPR
jgi:hypothetical protein